MLGRTCGASSVLLDRLEREGRRRGGGPATPAESGAARLAGARGGGANVPDGQGVRAVPRAAPRDGPEREHGRRLQVARQQPARVDRAGRGRRSEDGRDCRPSPTVEAMRRIVTETEDPAEGGRRFQEMVRSAIERFNEGSLAQAGTMIDLANQIIADRKVDPVAAQIDPQEGGRRRSTPSGCASTPKSPDLHPQLRKVLNFFLALTPGGTPRGPAARGEARAAASSPAAPRGARSAGARGGARGAPARCSAAAPRDEDWYFRRNLPLPPPADSPAGRRADRRGRRPRRPARGAAVSGAARQGGDREPRPAEAREGGARR